TRSLASTATMRGTRPRRAGSRATTSARSRSFAACSRTRDWASRMRVVVTGLVATYPVGGVAWDYLQYVEGFRRLGCDVFYVEGTGQWFYDPDARAFLTDATRGARYLADALQTIAPGFGDAWSVRAPDGVVHGQDRGAVRRGRAG